MSGLRRIILVHNPCAGGRSPRETLRRTTARLGAAVASIVETSVDGSYAARLRDAVREVRATAGDGTVVAVIGGDGTLSMTLDALDNTADAVLAVIPAGSGNDFAAAIGCGSFDRALAALERGAVRALDFGVVNGRRFANCIGIGLDAEVGALSSRLRSRGYPPQPSYYAAALVGLFMVKPVGITIASGGSAARYDRGVMLTVGNGPLYGGGFRGAPNALLDDGLLDVHVFCDVEGIGPRFALMQRIRAGTHGSRPNVTAWRCGALRAEFDREVAMHVDGEIAAVRSVDVEVVPAGMRVVCGPLASSRVAMPGAARPSS